VVEIVRHPRYDPSDSATPDLAVLKLAQPLPDRFIPAVLSARTVSTGDHLIVAGYGKSTADDPYGGTVLRTALLRVSYAHDDWLTLESAGQDLSGSCGGDSGGPAFTYRGMYAVVALMARGQCGGKTLVVALAPHHEWIRATIEKLSAP
jgi:hypothetical protein